MCYRSADIHIERSHCRASHVVKATIVLVHPELRRRFEDHRRHRRSAGDRQDPKPSGPTIPMAGALSNRVGSLRANRHDLSPL